MYVLPTISSLSDRIHFQQCCNCLCRFSYISLCMRKVGGRLAERPRLGTLISRRWSIFRWARKHLEDRAPSFHVCRARTNQILYFSALRYGVNQAPIARNYLGRRELHELIDIDMVRNDNIEVVENHHLAWIIRCVRGVRTDTIAKTADRPDSYLRWKDVHVTRYPESRVNFVLEPTFAGMKGYQEPAGTVTSHQELNLIVMPLQNAESIPLFTRESASDHSHRSTLTSLCCSQASRVVAASRKINQQVVNTSTPT